MKHLGYASGAVAVITTILALIARFFFADKSFLGIQALTYLIVTCIMLLYTIAFFLCTILRKS